MDTTLRLGCSSLCASGRSSNKRKLSNAHATQYPEDDFTLVLGLGPSPNSSENSKISSATVLTMSSGKESNEGSTTGPSLGFHLCLGTDGCTPNPKRPALAKVKASETGAICHLQLSLSAGPSSSVITTASPFSGNHDSLDVSLSVNDMTPDEGSTSSRWKREVSMLPPFHANQAVNNLNINLPDAGKVSSVPSMASLLSATTQVPKRSVSSTSRINLQRPRNTSSRTCCYQGCRKGARGASGLCIAHGGGRRCQKDGCHKGAEGRTPYCKAHGGGRRCESLGCTKSAEGRTNFCIAHGGGRRCSWEGCARAARGKSGLCIRHGGGKRCQRENCTKSAEGHSGLCISHGGGRRCQFRACTKGAQGSTKFCKAHGGGKRCTALGCTKGAEGSTPFCKGHGGGKRCSFQGGGVCPKSVHGGTQFCVAHGGGKRCAVLGCTKSARGRTDFCVRHGGGKRCKTAGCGKSAQGRTDFCKAHGGGKRCSWGQEGSGGPQCDRFARGKTGLCTAHSTLIQDRLVQEGISLGSDTGHNILLSGNSSANVENHGWSPNRVQANHPVQASVVTVPEGRVHGGSLMAMLATSGAGPGNQAKHLSDPSAATCVPPPHKWM